MKQTRLSAAPGWFREYLTEGAASCPRRLETAGTASQLMRGVRRTRGIDEQMDRLREQLAAKLSEIELEMRRIGYWDDAAPSHAEIGRQRAIRNYLDAPSFEWWLQRVFLPNATRALAEGHLPSSSEVGEIARRQYDCQSVVEEARGLMRLLCEFDSMVGRYAAE